MNWFAVQTIFQHRKSIGTATYEERIMLFLAKDVDVASRMAEFATSSISKVIQNLMHCRTVPFLTWAPMILLFRAWRFGRAFMMAPA